MARSHHQNLQKNPPPAPRLEDRIRMRAYEFFVERNAEPGHDVEDWLRAEEEVRADKKFKRIHH